MDPWLGLASIALTLFVLTYKLNGTYFEDNRSGEFIGDGDTLNFLTIFKSDDIGGYVKHRWSRWLNSIFKCINHIASIYKIIDNIPFIPIISIVFC